MTVQRPDCYTDAFQDEASSKFRSVNTIPNWSERAFRNRPMFRVHFSPTQNEVRTPLLFLKWIFHFSIWHHMFLLLLFLSMDTQHRTGSPCDPSPRGEVVLQSKQSQVPFIFFLSHCLQCWHKAAVPFKTYIPNITRQNGLYFASWFHTNAHQEDIKHTQLMSS